MAAYMTQQNLSLPPSSRQDVLSALLNDYGNSFEDGTSSSYNNSSASAPALRSLPPPSSPERARARKYSDDKPSPAAEKMNTPFQLRHGAISPESSDGSTPSEGSPTRIHTKRLSLNRRSVPHALALTVSNGSTAELPSVPTDTSQLEAQTAAKLPAFKEKRHPPPPPEKSTRRQQEKMGCHSSKARSLRTDSLHSPEEKGGPEEHVKDKQVSKFTSLADLGNGPRGGKGGPLPQPRGWKQVFEEQSAEDRGRTAMRNNNVGATSREVAQSSKLREAAPMKAPPIVNLPPTPVDEAIVVPTVPLKKPFEEMGLPPNPKHRKNKSSTGFDFMKSAKSPEAQQQQFPTSTITPRPTPSPRTPENLRQEINGDQLRVGPAMSSNAHRPFSFEPGSTSPPQKETLSNEDLKTTTTTTPRPSTPTIPLIGTAVTQDFPSRSASLVAPPLAVANIPSPQPSNMSEDANSASDSAPESPTIPFVPLTEVPVPHPGIPPITEKHHNCYSRHATFVWSKNDCQPMACMTCGKNDPERKWACVWCYLRICVACSTELQKTPGRNLEAMMERRVAEANHVGEAYLDATSPEEEASMHPGLANGKRHDSGNPTFVVWGADAEGVR